MILGIIPPSFQFIQSSDGTATISHFISNLSSYFGSFIANMPPIYAPIFVLFLGVAAIYLVVGRQA